METYDSKEYLATLTTSARFRVENSLNRTAVGDDVDWTTPLIPDGSSDFWREKRRDELLAQVLDSHYPWLNEVETEQAELIGPQSIMLPYDERKENVLKYFRQVRIKDSIYLRNAFSTMMGIMPRGLRPLSLKAAFDEMPTGTNLGAPFFTSDARYRIAVYMIALEVVESGFEEYDKSDPALLYWRGQSKGLLQIPKQRTIWGTPHWLTLLGLMIQGPLLMATREQPQFAAWNSVGRVNRVITDIQRRSRQDVLSGDFSGFDSSVPELLIRYAFELIRLSFDKSAGRLIDLLEERFLNLRLWTPEGILGGRNGGIPSGDTLTNYVGSLVNMMIWYAVADETGNELTDLTVQGDDAVISFSKAWDLAQISLLVHENFGMEVTSDKGGVSRTQIIYLQNVFNTQYTYLGNVVGIRPIMRTLNGMLSYERAVKKGLWNGYMDTLRWWQQAENSKYHPKFRSLVEFLFKYDRYSCLDPDTVLQRASGRQVESRAIAKVESVLKQPSFPYGKESLRGLRDFWVVQILEELCGETVRLPALKGRGQ